MEIDAVSLVKSVLENKKRLARPSGNIELWNKWYKGKDPSFHFYDVYNGERKTRYQRFSMHMGKKCCEDWASLLMNEKVSIGVKNQDLLDNVLNEIDFYNKTNKSVEYSFGLSMAGLCVELENIILNYDEEQKTDSKSEMKNATIQIDDKTKVNLGVYSAKKIVPITFENGEVTECAFVSENTDNTVLNIHIKNNENGNYIIMVVYVSKENNVIVKSVAFEVKYKMFAIVHPQLVNNIDVDSDYPISVFANAIDTLKSIDIAFDSYSNEFNLGRKRIFVSSEMDKVDKKTGDLIRYFDPNDIVIHQLPPTVAADGSQKPLIQEVNGALRIQEHSQGIQDLLNFFSSQVGLGVDYYRFEKGRVMTATQVISEKSDTFRNLKKHEGVFEKALMTIITALQYAHNEFTTSQEKFTNIEEVSIHFDDSIIEDKNTEKTSDQKDVEFGAMSLVSYRMKWFAEDEKTATESMKKIYGDADFLRRISNFAPFLVQGTLTPLQFVKMVYVEITSESEQQALADEIKENLKSGSEVFSDADLMSFRSNGQNE